MGFTASDLADWFDDTADEYWRQQDDWLIQAYNLGDAHPVIVFADWFTNYMNTAPQRFALSTAGGIADVLRLGNDLTLDSVGGFAKGVALTVVRLLTAAAPFTSGAKNEIRHRGLLALMELESIVGSKHPCQYTALNNIASFLKGRKVQYFADLQDIVAVGGDNEAGMYIKRLLEHPSIVRLIGRNGITWRPLAQAKTIEDVLAAAKQSEGPVRFTFTWMRNGKKAAHAVVAIKDLKGNVRIIDYTEGPTAAVGKQGYVSWKAMVDGRKARWGEGLTEAKLSVNANDLPAEFTSTVLKVLTTADGVTTFGLPVAVGMKWVKDTKAGGRFADAAPAIAKSVNDYFEKKVGDGKGPGTPESLYPPPTRPPETVSVMYTHTVEGPSVKQSDWLSSIAKKWYGDMLLWPIIFDFNRTAQFSNPNVIVVGQRIKVPFINNMTPAQLADYRKRGLNWK